jgi:hypothetical protein
MYTICQWCCKATDFLIYRRHLTLMQAMLAIFFLSQLENFSGGTDPQNQNERVRRWELEYDRARLKIRFKAGV